MKEKLPCHLTLVSHKLTKLIINATKRVFFCNIGHNNTKIFLFFLVDKIYFSYLNSQILSYAGLISLKALLPLLMHKAVIT